MLYERKLLMKYGVLSYERKALSLNGRDAQNLGDWIQTIAMEGVYQEFGITDYSFVSRNDAAAYDGEEVRLVVNGYHTLINRMGYRTNTFPLSTKIRPIFFSIHFHDECIPEEMKHQLSQYGPVGCRDERTVNNLRQNGINAFLSGCVTALLPRRVNQPDKQNKVLLVDAPKGIESVMPDALGEKAEYLTQLFAIERTQGEPCMTRHESAEAYVKAKELLNYYEENAALVITSRLHTAVPCMAMGIPVILVKEDFDERFSWIDKYLPLYSKEKWEKIQWCPSTVEYEEEKVQIKECLKRLLFEDYNGEKKGWLPGSFYDDRIRCEYNKILKTALKSIVERCNEKEEYSLWGVTDNTLRLNHVIKEIFPEWKLADVYDLMVDGVFEGITIKHPDSITTEGERIYFVVAPKAQLAAKEKLDSLGNKYIFVDVNSSDWYVSF